MIFRVAVIATGVITTLITPAAAQRGTLQGELVERTGAARPANICPLFRFPGTDWSTELKGFFSVEILPGRYECRMHDAHP